MVNKRKDRLALMALCLWSVMGQIEFAPANMGLKLSSPDAHVKAVPGRNPNMPPWFEDLGVDSFGQILGHADLKSLQAPEASKSPLNSMVLTDKDKNVLTGEVGDEITAGQAQNIIKAENDVSSSDSNSSISTDSSSSKEEVEGSTSWETISLGNSTEAHNRTVVKVPEPIKIEGVPYPREVPTHLSDSGLLGNNIPEDASMFTDETTLMPPAEKMATEQYNPKVRNIPLWKPKSKGPEPPPVFILPPDNPERIVVTNVDMLRPIVATSTWTTKISGSVVTSTTVSTVDQRALKFKSCIFGCPELTSSDSLVGTTTIVTVLPYQLPCSLVSCPPCPACFQSTVRVSVCPFIETVQAKARTTFVNGPTITVIRSTVTRTKCTETRTISVKPTPCSCPTETATVTVTVEGQSSRSRSSLSDGKSQFVDPALVMDFPSDQSPVESVVQKNNAEASTVTETIMSTVFATPSKKLASLTITKTVFNDRVMVTVTTTVLPVTTPTEENTGVCSTFIICNPTQFTCPAQVTNLPQIKAVVQSIMEGQEKYGSAGVVKRRLTPNGAFIDEGSAGLFGDGLEMVGGLAPINAFGFGPGGMFEKVLGPGLVPSKETIVEVLQPPQQQSSTATAMKATVVLQSAPVSSTRIIEAQPTVEGEDQTRRTVIKRSRKQSASSASSSLMHYSGALLVTILSAVLYLVI